MTDDGGLRFQSTCGTPVTRFRISCEPLDKHSKRLSMGCQAALPPQLQRLPQQFCRRLENCTPACEATSKNSTERGLSTRHLSVSFRRNTRSRSLPQISTQHATLSPLLRTWRRG